MPEISSDLIQELQRFVETLRGKFSQPEFIPGCEVVSVADINEYATNNGWIEAICGRHNRQRVRWKSAELVAVSSYIDVLHFPDRRVFEAYGLGGSSAVSVSGGGWPGAGKAMINSTEYATITAAITAASAGDIIKIGQGSFAETVDVNKAVTLVGASNDDTIITNNTSTTTLTVSAAGAVVANVKVVNTSSGDAISVTAATAKLMSVVAESTAASGTNKAAFSVQSATLCRLIDCDGTCSGAATLNRGITVFNNGLVEVVGGKYNGGSYDISVSSGATATLVNPILAGGSINGLGAVRGTASDDKGRDCGVVVLNTSGATVGRGDIGYVNEDGDFKTTTTANDNVNWHVVAAGGPNNAMIFCKNRGNATVAYTGSAPSVGDYLVTSTSAGDAQAQATMRPEIFAVCLAAGSGGLVEALLLTQTKLVSIISATLLYSNTSGSDTDFTATINGAPTATSVVYNAPSSGSEDVIKPGGSGQLFKALLWNTTRSSGRLIDSVDTGTNTITTVSSTDTWANGDTITIQSQTVSTGGVPFAFELDGSQNTNAPNLSRYISIELQRRDTTLPANVAIHPIESYSSTKTQTIQCQVANTIISDTRSISLINRRFAVINNAGASGTADLFIKLVGYYVAIP